MIRDLRQRWARWRVRRARTREAATDWRVTLHRRALVAGGILACWATGIEARLVYLQTVRYADLVARAGRQQTRTIELPANRGDIIDRKGHVLATSADADTIYAVPSEIVNAADTVARLCRALEDCAPKERQSLTERLSMSRAFTYVRRQIASDVAQRVAALNLEGIGFVKESRRYYPNNELAAPLIGYVGIDNSGLSGIEAAYNSTIHGKQGTVLIQTDAKRHAFSRFERPPTTGATIELTIDEYIQHVVERELHAGVLANHAAGGAALVMNPHTGEILAMASEPTFNPNSYRDFSEIERRNRVVQDLYEPGSTFKVVTASAAIEEKVMPIDTMIDTNPGVIHIGSRVVTEASHHNYGVLSMSDVIVKSSNIGAIKIGFRVGTERLSRFVQRFGFGHPVSPDFPGESPGIVWDAAKWTDSALASVSMGYQVGVTPLQMATAVSSVANGGLMMEPRVIRAVYRSGRRYAVRPHEVRRTISADTAAVLTGIMEGVVERGTARAAQIGGYTIAGKTGTAAKLVNGHYSHSDYNASFVGFVPSRNPAITVIVVIDSPHAGPTTGGAVSAPVFKRIVEATLTYLGVGPTLNPEAPVLVQNDPPPVDAPVVPVGTPIIDVTGGSGPEGSVVPDVHGLDARYAAQVLAKAGLKMRASGIGSVVSQDPEPGSPIEKGSFCRVVLERSVTHPQSAAAQP